MSDLTLRLALTKNYLDRQTTLRPKVAIVLGSGLGTVAELVQGGISIAYKDIPSFPTTGVAGHEGRLIIGHACGHVPALVFEGRAHHYEGLTMQQVAYPAFVAHALGASVLIVTNAAGGIRAGMHPGDLMLIRDHLNLMGDNPLRGEHASGRGSRFPSLRGAYDEALLDLALRAAQAAGIALHLGVYAAMNGPAYETDAELRMVHALGADAVGMSTVPEVIAARALGMRVMGVSVIANDASPRRPHDGLEPAHEDVLRVVGRSAGALRTILEGVLDRLDVERARN
jgi:purine-nucleoside phosphorylase